MVKNLLKLFAYSQTKKIVLSPDLEKGKMRTNPLVRISGWH